MTKNDPAYTAIYRERHRQELRDKQALYREAHRTELAQKQHRYAIEHPIEAGRWWKEHPDAVAANHRKARYGITEQEYQAQLALQGGVCALCRRPETAIGRTRLAVDHDHETGRMRGLLCIGCNISLGYFERGWKTKLDPDVVAAYLEATQ